MKCPHCNKEIEIQSGFTDIGDGAFKDNVTGLVWLAPLDKRMTYDEAMEFCKGKDFRLPTIEEFKIAEINGIRKTDDSWEGRYFWSSSVDDDGVAWGFSGDYAKAYYGFRNDPFSVRCVAR